LKVSKSVIDHSSIGDVLHTDGPENVKAYSPYFLRCVHGLESRFALDDLRLHGGW